MAKYRGGEADSKSGTRRNRWSNSLLRFYRPVPDTAVVLVVRRERSIRGKGKRGGVRTNELNRRKKKFRSEKPRIGQDFYSSFYDLNRPRRYSSFDLAFPRGGRTEGRGTTTEWQESAVDFTLYFYDIPRNFLHRCNQPTNFFPPSCLGFLSPCLSTPPIPSPPISSGLSARCYRGKEQFHFSPHLLPTPIQRLLSDLDDSILPLPLPAGSSTPPGSTRNRARTRSTHFSWYLAKCTR